MTKLQKIQQNKITLLTNLIFYNYGKEIFTKGS